MYKVVWERGSNPRDPIRRVLQSQVPAVGLYPIAEDQPIMYFILKKGEIP
jgi:hypothetical protein